MGDRNLAGGCHAENQDRHFRAAEPAAGDRIREGRLYPGVAENYAASSGRGPGLGRDYRPTAEEAVWQLLRGDASAGGRGTLGRIPGSRAGIQRRRPGAF